MQVCLCPTHPHGRLEACREWRLGRWGNDHWQLNAGDHHDGFDFMTMLLLIIPKKLLNIIIEHYPIISLFERSWMNQCVGLRACHQPHLLHMAGQHQRQDQWYSNGENDFPPFFSFLPLPLILPSLHPQWQSWQRWTTPPSTGQSSSMWKTPALLTSLFSHRQVVPPSLLTITIFVKLIFLTTKILACFLATYTYYILTKFEYSEHI